MGPCAQFFPRCISSPVPSPAHAIAEPNWRDVLANIELSRELDRVEVEQLVPSKEVLYQFSATGHELSQSLLGQLLNHPHDAVAAYYRSRPLILALGLTPEEALAATLGKSGGISDGRDIGVVWNRPSTGLATVLPMAGDVGTQFTPALGWAEAVEYRRKELGQDDYCGAIAVACGGDASVATAGFWAALNTAATLCLPLLVVVEDNGIGISVPSTLQTPNGDIAQNLASMNGLKTLAGDGAEPDEAWALLSAAVEHVRSKRRPVLLQLRVPRICGHSGGDAQPYRTEVEKSAIRLGDPLIRLRAKFGPEEIADARRVAERRVQRALLAARSRHSPSPSAVTRYMLAEPKRLAKVGDRAQANDLTTTCKVEAGRPMSMRAAIARTLETELASDPRVRVFGEDVGILGGVYGVTAGLQRAFGESRVFDTSLSEEGIIGRSLGMALCGLRPVPEIQFRKYADAAAEQLSNIATLRWRTANHFAAPVVVRMAGGHGHCADPWHSTTDEVGFVHRLGWRLAVPSNAEDAVGLLRSALRGRDPTVFFEHRALMKSIGCERLYPGDNYAIPFGSARTVIEGEALTIVTWGGMVHRCTEAAEETPAGSVEVIDLRTLRPWDADRVCASVRKTRRCLIVHEDAVTAGFGAEIAATVAERSFACLVAPVRRIGAPDVPLPYSLRLLAKVLPTPDHIRQVAVELMHTCVR